MTSSIATATLSSLTGIIERITFHSEESGTLWRVREKELKRSLFWKLRWSIGLRLGMFWS
ncbi:MAG: hypothetical protein AAFQ80_25350 [Cyanobacteria bacterium J06621_8]